MIMPQCSTVASLSQMGLFSAFRLLAHAISSGVRCPPVSILNNIASSIPECKTIGREASMGTQIDGFESPVHGSSSAIDRITEALERIHSALIAVATLNGVEVAGKIQFGISIQKVEDTRAKVSN